MRECKRQSVLGSFNHVCTDLNTFLTEPLQSDGMPLSSLPVKVAPDESNRRETERADNHPELPGVPSTQISSELDAQITL